MSIFERCLSDRESSKESKKGGNQLKVSVYKDVCHIEVSVKRESTVHGQNTELR